MEACGICGNPGAKLKICSSASPHLVHIGCVQGLLNYVTDYSHLKCHKCPQGHSISKILLELRSAGCLHFQENQALESSQTCPNCRQAFNPNVGNLQPLVQLKDHESPIRRNTTDHGSDVRSPLLQSISVTNNMGLKNIGLSCFMNVVLNSLYFIPPFHIYFAHLKKPVSKNLTSLVRDFVLQYGKQTISSRNLADIQTHSPKFPLRDVGSAYLFLLSLLDKFDQENVQTRIDIPQAMFNDGSDKEFRRFQDSGCKPLREIFSVQIEEKRTCSHCWAVKSKYIYQRSLSLNLISSRQQGDLSLYSCLDHFMAPKRDSVDAPHYCENCENDQIHEIQKALRGLGSALIINLQRLHSTYSTSEVYVPISLELQDSTRFELFSAVCHRDFGRVGGHYVCCCKTESGWVLFDDYEPVRRLESPQDYLNSATLFIYVRA